MTENNVKRAIRSFSKMLHKGLFFDFVLDACLLHLALVVQSLLNQRINPLPNHITRILVPILDELEQRPD